MFSIVLPVSIQEHFHDCYFIGATDGVRAGSDEDDDHHHHHLLLHLFKYIYIYTFFLYRLLLYVFLIH